MNRYALYIEKNGSLVEIPGTKGSLESIDKLTMSCKDEKELLGYMMHKGFLSTNSVYKKIIIGCYSKGILHKLNPIYKGTSNSVTIDLYIQIKEFTIKIRELYDKYIKSVYSNNSSNYDYEAITKEMRALHVSNKNFYKMVKTLASDMKANVTAIEVYDGFITRNEPMSKELVDNFYMCMLTCLNRILFTKKDNEYVLNYRGFRDFYDTYYRRFGRKMEINKEIVKSVIGNKGKNAVPEGQLRIEDVYGDLIKPDNNEMSSSQK